MERLKGDAEKCLRDLVSIRLCFQKPLIYKNQVLYSIAFSRAKVFIQVMNHFSGVVLSHPETIVRDKYHHYNQLMSNNYKTYEMGPNFDSKLPQNVTAIHGKETELVCRVFELGNKTVSKIFALFFMLRHLFNVPF